MPFDEQLWHTDPLRLTERGPIDIDGLGTSDMKAFFALTIEALRGLDLRQLKRPLVILATADEESNMPAQSRCRAAVISGRHALIGEPTGLRPVRNAQRHYRWRSSACRAPGHSSNPALGSVRWRACTWS